MNKTQSLYQYLKIDYRYVTSAIFIGLGVFGKLIIPNVYISSILFAFGLWAVCTFKSFLFTGKCGYILQGTQDITDVLRNIFKLLAMLFYNLCFGFLIGLIFSITEPTVADKAQEIVSVWQISWQTFFKSLFCGVIMFIAVEANQRQSSLGILYGVPLFLLCGFQHSIANIIIMGAAYQNHILYILLCALGNWIGSLLMYLLLNLNSTN